jgi:hypothetical protein
LARTLIESRLARDPSSPFSGGWYRHPFLDGRATAERSECVQRKLLCTGREPAVPLGPLRKAKGLVIDQALVVEVGRLEL